ncbi:MAG: hypothetical protein ABIL44_01135 [candidate division WOR-3 bacterium]
MTWYRERPQRYQKEIEVLRKFYPRTKICWERNLLVAFNEFFTRQNRYLIKVIYPDGFPYDHPRAYVVSPRIHNAPHRYSDGALSIHFDNDGPQISGKIIFDGAKKWIAAYEHWQKTGYWPEGW